MKYKLGIGIGYYKQNRIVETCFRYLMEILELELKDVDGVHLLVYQNEVGLAKARNKLLEELIKDCEYITFIDADDRIAPDYIEKILEAIKTKAPIYQTDFYILEDLHRDTELKNRNTGVIYRNDIIKNVRYNESRNYGEDKEFNDNLRDYPVELIDTYYYYNYGINPDCMTYKYSRGEIKEFKYEINDDFNKLKEVM